MLAISLRNSGRKTFVKIHGLLPVYTTSKNFYCLSLFFFSLCELSIIIKDACACTSIATSKIEIWIDKVLLMALGEGFLNKQAARSNYHSLSQNIKRIM